MLLFVLLVLCITSQLGLADIKEAASQSPSVVNLPLTTTESLAPSPSNQNIGSGISCYVCNSRNDTDCYDEKNLKKEFIQKCEPFNGMNSIGCWKIEHWVNYDQSKELKAHNRIVRKCAYHKQEHACIYRSGYGAMVEHCLCNSTACNGIPNIEHNAPFLTLLSTFFCIITIKSFI